MRWVLLVFGVGIIVAAELLFCGNLENNVLTLDIIVSLIVWGVLFAGIGFPWIDLNDPAQKRVGSLGLFWYFSSLYAFLAILWMVVGAQFDLSFRLQLIVHLVLLFVLIMGLAMTSRASEKVGEVYEKEQSERLGVTNVREALAALKESTFDAKDLPEEVVDRITKMCDEARFVSPSNNMEAHRIEDEMVGLIHEISSAFFNYQMNEEAIQSKLARCERLLRNRKQIHSN